MRKNKQTTPKKKFNTKLRDDAIKGGAFETFVKCSSIRLTKYQYK